MRNSIHNTLSGVSMYCLIHHQGSRCINEYIIRGGVVLENVSSPLRFITKYIHFCLFNKVNVISNTFFSQFIFIYTFFGHLRQQIQPSPFAICPIYLYVGLLGLIIYLAAKRRSKYSLFVCSGTICYDLAQ